MSATLLLVSWLNYFSKNLQLKTSYGNYKTPPKITVWFTNRKTHVKCSEKPSAERFAVGKNSRRLSSILPRFRSDIRSSRLLSTRYSLKKSVINERTSPLETRLSLSSGWNTVSGGSPDSFWENVRAVKTASFFLSFSSKSSSDCRNLRITFSRFFMRKGLLRKIFCMYKTDGKIASRFGSQSKTEWGWRSPSSGFVVPGWVRPPVKITYICEMN